MPFKDPQKRKAYKRQYDKERTALVHKAKEAFNLPIDKRKKAISTA